jgi:hypothetical protein
MKRGFQVGELGVVVADTAIEGDVWAAFAEKVEVINLSQMDLGVLEKLEGQGCSGSLRHCQEWLVEAGHSVGPVLAWLKRNRVHCDGEFEHFCSILSGRVENEILTRPGQLTTERPVEGVPAVGWAAVVCLIARSGIVGVCGRPVWSSGASVASAERHSNGRVHAGP